MAITLWAVAVNKQIINAIKLISQVNDSDIFTCPPNGYRVTVANKALATCVSRHWVKVVAMPCFTLHGKKGTKEFWMGVYEFKLSEATSHCRWNRLLVFHIHLLLLSILNEEKKTHQVSRTVIHPWQAIDTTPLGCGTMTQRTLKKVTTVDWKYSQINVSSKWSYYSSSSATLSHRCKMLNKCFSYHVFVILSPREDRVDAHLTPFGSEV